MDLNYAIISAIVGALAAIIYSLKILISLERKIINIDKNLALIITKQKKK